MFLAVLQTDINEYVCYSDTPDKAKVGVFEAYNTFLKRGFELENKFSIETTSEYLDKKLREYYEYNLGGRVSIKTLNEAFELFVLEMKKDEVYKDGSLVPRREQDF